MADGKEVVTNNHANNHCDQANHTNNHDVIKDDNNHVAPNDDVINSVRDKSNSDESGIGGDAANDDSATGTRDLEESLDACAQEVTSSDISKPEMNQPAEEASFADDSGIKVDLEANGKRLSEPNMGQFLKFTKSG